MTVVRRCLWLVVSLLLAAGCATPPPGPAAGDVPVARGAEPNYKVVKVHFATDRAPTGNQAAAKFFGSAFGEGVTYGTCEVSIPRDHHPGELESPSIWRLEFTPDPGKHIVLTMVQPQETGVFFDELKQRLAASDAKKAFVFVHGFNVNFEEAARRTAQIHFDLHFGGVPVFYSWPSQGSFLSYRDDEISVSRSEPHLKAFFSDLANRLNADEIYVIAHSMGNRPTSRALAALFAEKPDLATRFKEIILMAPDMDADVFKKEVAPPLLGLQRRVTLYASSKDAALKVSKVINGGQRLGDSDPEIVILPGMESIDASNVDTDLIGHSYYADAGTVLSDLFELVRDKGSASVRSHLEEILTGLGRFWRFKAFPASGGVAAARESLNK